MIFNRAINLFEMANVRPNKTGLKMVIYISPIDRQAKHGPRIKVSKKYGDKIGKGNSFSISFDRLGNVKLEHKKTGDIKSSDVEDALRFVELNWQILLSLWDDKIDSIDAVSQFIKV
jgi:hypothetical protein